MKENIKKQVIAWLNSLKETECDPQRKLFTKAVQVVESRRSSYSYSNVLGDIENDGRRKITLRLPNKPSIEITQEEMLKLLKTEISLSQKDTHKEKSA